MIHMRADHSAHYNSPKLLRFSSNLSFSNRVVCFIMATYLITGSSRGLGLALVAQLALQPAGKISKIIASSRGKPTAELQKVIDSSSHRAVWVQLDVVDKASVQQAATQVESILEGKGLDVLINNSGVIKWQEARIETMYVSLLVLNAKLVDANVPQG